MKKLFELLKLKRVDGDFGIEIEVEGTDKEIPDPRWKREADGSLRGLSSEYIFRNPLPRADVRNALESLKGSLAKEKLKFSFRTSVHVHMNVQNLTFTQYLNTIYIYLLLEEPFLNYCGKERKGNRFCLRLQDAEGILDVLNNVFAAEEQGVPRIARLQKDAIRYASINLGATQQYGSLEFRAMRGNLDVDVIDVWVEALHRVRQFAIKCEDPADVFKRYAELGPLAFLEAVLGDVDYHFAYPRMVKDIQRSFSLSLDLPHSYSASVEAYEKKKKEEAEYGAAVDVQPIKHGDGNWDLLVKIYRANLEKGLRPVDAERDARKQVRLMVDFNQFLAAQPEQIQPIPI